MKNKTDAELVLIRTKYMLLYYSVRWYPSAEGPVYNAILINAFVLLGAGQNNLIAL
jgi:hypothetical protein